MLIPLCVEALADALDGYQAITLFAFVYLLQLLIIFLNELECKSLDNMTIKAFEIP